MAPTCDAGVAGGNGSLAAPGNGSLAAPGPSPGPAPLESGAVAVGIVLAVAASFGIALGTNIQRLGLAVVGPRGERCSCAGRDCCVSRGTFVWGCGWLVYGFGGGVCYTIAVAFAPATLCAALLCTIVIFNGVISRLLLGEELRAHDYHGGVLILSGIALSQAFGPTSNVDMTAPELLETLGKLGSAMILVLMSVATLALAAIILLDEAKRRAVGRCPDDTGDKEASREGLELATASEASAAAAAATAERDGIVSTAYAATHIERSGFRAALVCFAYPAMVGMIEGFQQIFLVSLSRLLYLTLEGRSQLCFAIFWLLGVGLFALVLAQIWWLRKALLVLEVSRVLPIEYGVTTLTSMLASLFVLGELEFVPGAGATFIVLGMILILAGCLLIGFQTPIPGLECRGKRQTRS